MIYQEVRGAGPTLLLIPGGSGDAGGYEAVAGRLADRLRVVTYDRRGFSRSADHALDRSIDRLATDVDDAAELLGDSPGYVFGSSSGAIVALALLTRYPDRIRKLVAHEPPLASLVPDGGLYLKLFDDVYETYRREGVEPAMRVFFAGVGMAGPALPSPDRVLPPHVVELLGRLRANQGYWIEHELRQYPRYEPDLGALKAVVDRLVLAGGTDGRHLFPYRPNLVLAERLGVEVVDFPGDHTGYVSRPAEFAVRLVDVLRPGPPLGSAAPTLKRMRRNSVAEVGDE
jgi:pimeloyl-ACP methyl ester carboxylesterase